MSPTVYIIKSIKNNFQDHSPDRRFQAVEASFEAGTSGSYWCPRRACRVTVATPAVGRNSGCRGWCLRRRVLSISWSLRSLSHRLSSGSDRQFQRDIIFTIFWTHLFYVFLTTFFVATIIYSRKNTKTQSITYILQDFLFRIGIWIWAVENLGSSHHASVVRGLDRASFYECNE